jgi:hypothetical protein
MDTFNVIHTQLNTVSGLCDSMGMEKGMEFIQSAARLKDLIIHLQPPSYDPSQAPHKIPNNIKSLLSSTLDIPDQFVDGCWTAFRHLVWTYKEQGEVPGIVHNTSELMAHDCDKCVFIWDGHKLGMFSLQHRFLVWMFFL